MQFPGFHNGYSGSFARRLIREHAQWLTRALRSGRPQPRIPVRKVADGGFVRLSRTREGRRIAEQWWFSAFESMD